MKMHLLCLVAAIALAAIPVGCGTTPEPTEPPPTQTPWIVVVTATAVTGEEAQAQPTQTPWIIVATPTPAPTERATARSGASPTATTRPTQTVVTPTPKPPRPTGTPAAAESKYPPPALLDPPYDQPVSWKSTVLLKWSSVGELGEDEYYRLHLERRPKTEGETWYGDYVFTKQTEYLAEGSFLAPFHPSAEHGQAWSIGGCKWCARPVKTRTANRQASSSVGPARNGRWCWTPNLMGSRRSTSATEE